MKATGIIRKVDELGRIVIPKELRRSLRIREGDPLEIYTDNDGEVIFKKYSPVGEISEFASQLCDSMYRATNCSVAICDRDSVVSVAGIPKREIKETRISDDLRKIMSDRRPYISEGSPVVPMVSGDELNYVSAAATIISEGDIMGCVVFTGHPHSKAPTDLQLKLADTVAGFLGKQMEN